MTYWPEYQSGSSIHQGLSTYQVVSFLGKAFLSYQLHKVKGTDIPTDMCKAICPAFFKGGHNAPPFSKGGGGIIKIFELLLIFNLFCVSLENIFVIKETELKLTRRHINRRHFCFNIKSISVHPLLWMNVMLDFIWMVFAGMWTTFC